MRQWTVDAFASQPFRGNPACVLEPFAVGQDWPAEAWMQALAQENNQAETAYLRRTSDAARFELRWFTPATEVPLCGHATLASAHVLYEELGLECSEVVFQTRRAGELRVGRSGEGYRMDFPADPPRRIDAPIGLAEALGIEPVEVWAGQYLLAVLEDEGAVRRLAPDIAGLSRIGEGGARGNVAVAALGLEVDVVSRFFAPGSGIPEDPTTGSLHCLLAPLYADKIGRPRNRFHQAFPGRGGDLVCEVRGDRVLIEGQATTVAESRLRL